MKRSVVIGCMAILVACSSVAQATIRNVRTNATYDWIQDAVTAAASGDTIEVSGYYSLASCSATIDRNLTIRGVGATRPILDGEGYCLNGLGIFSVTGTTITIDNIEFQNSRNTGGNNACGIRNSATKNLTIRNCRFYNNEDGIMGGGAGSTASVLIENSEFDHNGYGDGFSHNMYIGPVGTFTLRYSWSHNAVRGHEVKTRGLVNYIQYNRIGNEANNSTYNASYEIDVPQAGTTYIIGNTVEQGPNTDNPTIIAYAEEGNTNADRHLYIVNNTIVNNLGYGTFLYYATAKGTAASGALVQNNIMAGGGTLVGGQSSNVTLNNNYTGTAYFVNAASYDYHLAYNMTGAIDKGVTPNPTTGVGSGSLIPTYQYVHPCSMETRPTNGVMDIGAYEYTGINQAPTVDAGANQVITLPTTSVTLNGSVNDDGLPLPSNLTCTWSKVSGPTSVSFSSPNSASTRVTGLTVAGTYVLQLTASDTQLTGSDVVTIIVQATPNNPPTVDAGPNQTITLPTSSVTLAGTAQDDGLPNPPGSLTYTWSQDSGPATVSFTTPSSASTTATGLNLDGTYVLRLTASDGILSASDTVTITVLHGNWSPIVDVGSGSIAVFENQQVRLHADAVDPDNDPLTYTWVQTTGQTIASPTGTGTADCSFTAPILTSRTGGTMTFQVTVNDGRGGITSANVNVQVHIRSDINGDWCVNVGDLQLLVAAWGSVGDGSWSSWNPLADLDQDGYIGVSDLQLLVARWDSSL